MINRMKIIIFAFSAFLIINGYNWIYQFSFGAPRIASWWIHDVMVKKENISDKSTDKRIVIISGSNGLFGFDSKLLEKKTGLPVINLALHASLDMNFYRWFAERNIRKGDIVILPIEYNYYTLNDPYNEWFIDNILAWGQSYLRWVSPIEYVRFMFHVEISKVSSAAMSNYYIKKSSSYKTKLHADEEIISYIYDGSFHEYDFRSIDNHGDILSPAVNKRAVVPFIEEPDKNKLGLYYMKNTDLTEYGINSVASLVKSIESLGANAFLTWPATMKTAYFNKNDPQSAKLINKIKNEMNIRGVKTYCSPWDVNIYPKNFYDTVYHLNKDGARIRTEAVYSCLENEKLLKPSV